MENEIKKDLSAERQELFNKIYLGLKSQGFESSRSAYPSGSCRYRGDGGRKCAVGWLIPDEVYTPEMESSSLPSVLCRLGIESAVHMNFLSWVMGIHDNSVSPEEMRVDLENFAYQNHLSIPE